MENTREAKIGIETNPTGPALVRSRASGNKQIEKMIANKQRKKRAHRRRLRASNANG